jgi:hypothetical protein
VLHSCVSQRPAHRFRVRYESREEARVREWVSLEVKSDLDRPRAFARRYLVVQVVIAVPDFREERGLPVKVAQVLDKALA